MKAPDQWPRMMRRDIAAAYCGVSLGRFLKEVGLGIWPAAEDFLDPPRWDRFKIDAAVDARNGKSAPSEEDEWERATDGIDQIGTR